MQGFGKNMRKYALASSAAFLLTSAQARADVRCDAAVSQLQQYVAMVNQTANFEYYQGIPQRCFGNQACAYSLLQQLNYWYQQQTVLVNQWYYQIAVACTETRPDRGDLPGRGTRPDKPMPDDVGDELEIDDEDRTVAIVIPDTPRGFRPRQ